MNNYIAINDQRIELTEEQVRQIVAAWGQKNNSVKLHEVSTGDTCKIGGHEFIVLEHFEDTTAIICKDPLSETMEFGENNNYDGSNVDEACREFAQKLAEIIGWENIVLHEVDLTTDDGLKDYGTIDRRASLLTADLYRRHVQILDKFKPGCWWWLATAFSTERHDDDSWVKCVSPSGYIDDCHCNFEYGVRPFCILKSNIFVSK